VERKSPFFRLAARKFGLRLRTHCERRALRKPSFSPPCSLNRWPPSPTKTMASSSFCRPERRLLWAPPEEVAHVKSFFFFSGRYRNFPFFPFSFPMAPGFFSLPFHRRFAKFFFVGVVSSFLSVKEMISTRTKRSRLRVLLFHNRTMGGIFSSPSRSRGIVACRSEMDDFLSFSSSICFQRSPPFPLPFSSLFSPSVRRSKRFPPLFLFQINVVIFILPNARLAVRS